MLFEWQGRYDEALTDLNMALADYPGNVAALARRARVRLLTDRPAEALADLGEAMRISPRDWNLNTWHSFSGVACLMLGRDEDAVGHFLRARAINPDRVDHALQLASAYQLVGRTAEARAALVDYAGRRPAATIGRWRGWLDALPVPENSLFRATVERQIGAVRAIGVLPEG